MCYYKIPPPKGESAAEAGMEAPGVEAGGAGRKKSKKAVDKAEEAWYYDQAAAEETADAL
ncbi:MAG TPA: hypothetical protein H9742_10410 [Candidatus Acetatifactor stercoripullorum]|uniref:Uncharacterized protein n=1 Tax=Candidatus Acetatifactor stercoripullorum TaxID=2838414 RepID=A0A9D1R886_9FIRM|nr:hypothetical protein [Candidatus Acetatifactor stercoripullorum]